MKRNAHLGLGPKLNKQSQKLTGATVIEELKAAHSAKEKAELLLLNLESLKTEVSAIEAQYDVLKADYTKICDDAILKISAVKTALEKDIESMIGDSEIFKSGMSSLEARFKLGLIPAETFLKQKEIPSEKVIPSPVGPQLVIDKAADSIELGLTKIGDGIIYLGEKTIHAFSAILKIAAPKQ